MHWKNPILPRIMYQDIEHFTSPFGIKVRRFISPVFRRILRCATGHTVYIESFPELEKGVPYIFASTHHFVEDIIINLAYCDRNAYVLIGTPDQVEHNPQLYAAWINGMIYVNKANAENRKQSVDKMEKVLRSGTSIVLFPEGSWNNSENLLVQPLFAGPWLLAKRTGCKVVPVAMYHDYLAKDVYVRYGEPLDLAGLEKKEALCNLRDAMASMTFQMMQEHAPQLKRSELYSDTHVSFMEKRKNEYLRTKWTRDDFEMEITCYRDKGLPPLPAEVRASLDNVKITNKNAKILAPILCRREEDLKYDFVQYMHEHWNT